MVDRDLMVPTALSVVAQQLWTMVFHARLKAYINIMCIIKLVHLCLIKQVQQNPYRPSNSDYYNVNPGAKAGMAAGTQATSAAAVETPSMQALKRMGSEPLLAPDKVTKPEAPEAVTVNQSVTQDLSLPEDDFNKHYPTAINNNPTQRAANGTGRMLVYPLRSLMYSGAGMAVGAASMAGMYAIRR